MLLLLSLFASCASTKKGGPQVKRIAHPYEFMDFDHDVYCTLPVDGNESLINAFVKAIAPKMSDFSLSQLTAKTDALYVATDLTTTAAKANEPIEFQFVATGDFPLSYRSMLFTKKNGFREVVEEQKSDATGAKSRTFNYFYNDQVGFFIDIPSENYCFADTEYLSGMIFAQEQTFAGTVFTPDWDEAVKNYLFSPKTSASIDWFLASPAGVVSAILGPTMRLPLLYAFGSLTAIDEAAIANGTGAKTNGAGSVKSGANVSGVGAQKPLLYTMDITLKVSDKRFVKPNIALLKMSLEQFRVTDSRFAPPVVADGGDACISVSGLVIDAGKIVGAFTPKENEKK